MFSAVTGSTVGTSGRAQMPPMVRVGRAQWRSHGATGEAGNGRPPLRPPRDAVITPCSIYRGSPTHRKPRHRPAHQPPHLPQGPRGAPCLFSFGRVRYQGLRCVVGVGGSQRSSAGRATEREGGHTKARPDGTPSAERPISARIPPAAPSDGCGRGQAAPIGPGSEECTVRRSISRSGRLLLRAAGERFFPRRLYVAR